MSQRNIFSEVRRGLASSVVLLIAICCVPSCNRRPTDRVQGYVEGEFVYVASPIAGQLETLSVARGDQVKAGEPLFSLENKLETHALEEANRKLAEAGANLEDAKKGKRPSEIQSMQAQLDQAKAALAYAQSEFDRVEQLIKSGGISQQQYDEDKSNRDQAQQHLAQIEADLETAGLGQRSDQIAAAEEEVKAQQAAVAQAQWNLSQKHQDAPESGQVFDTLYQQGEWVESGHPIAELLPPEHVKVRAFVSETRVGSLQAGDGVQIIVDGVSAPYAGKISFVSPRAEYTPPVIYSQESRDKLVFMIEIVFDGETAAKLHPGQPVDVAFGGTP
jgi:HlyD family secretion protein